MHLGKRNCMGSGSVECVAWSDEGGHLASWCLCEPAAGQANGWHAEGAGQPAPWAWPWQGWWDRRDGASDVGPCVHAGVTIRPDSCISTGTPMQSMYSMWKGMDARRYGDHSGPFFCLLKHSIQLVMLSYTAIRNLCPALRSFKLPDWQLRLHSLGFAVTLHPRIFHAMQRLSRVQELVAALCGRRGAQPASRGGGGSSAASAAALQDCAASARELVKETEAFRKEALEAWQARMNCLQALCTYTTTLSETGWLLFLAAYALHLFMNGNACHMQASAPHRLEI
jgi:hypothetical protein